MSMKAGIIGGTGKMGRLFAKVFEQAGYEVLVSGRTTALTAADLAEQCDIVDRLGPDPGDGPGDRRDRPAHAGAASSSATSPRSR